MRGLEVQLTLQKPHHLSKQFHSVSNKGFAADSIADHNGVFYIFFLLLFVIMYFCCCRLFRQLQVLLCPDLVTYEEIPTSVMCQVKLSRWEV